MIELIHRVVFILLILKLLMTMYQRKFNDTGGKKRILSLYQSLYIGVLYIALSGIIANGYSLNFVYIALFVTIIVGILLRKVLFPYKLKCEICQKKLNITQILFIDSKKCLNCQK